MSTKLMAKNAKIKKKLQGQILFIIVSKTTFAF